MKQSNPGFEPNIKLFLFCCRNMRKTIGLLFSALMQNAAGRKTADIFHADAFNNRNTFFNRFFVTISGLTAVLGMILAVVTVFGPAYAQGGFARGYGTSDRELQPGMVVALSPSSSPGDPLVERATREAIDRVIGVATELDDNLVTITSTTHQVYVQDDGEVQAFVSDMNGQVSRNDRLALSPLKGILMRGDDTTPVIGRALENFTDIGAQTQQVQTPSGSQTVKTIKISIALGSSLVYDQGQQESSLQRIGRSITGKQTSDLQVIVALIIFMIVLVAEGSILYGAISSGIISVGRNPLAQNIIRGELLRVIVVALAVLLIGLGAIYFILHI
jgi:hypothetical protein